jgi:hypothetical protein
MKPIPTLSESDLKRFWSKVDRSGDCWLWTGSLACRGYGKFSIGGRAGSSFIATRVSYAIAKGTPGNINVCHTCDNPACVNPSHLWLGTQEDNMDDASKKDCIAHGERQGHSKLTEQDVLEILTGRENCRVTGEKYRVTSSNISAIRLGKSWNRVTGLPRYLTPLPSSDRRRRSEFRD